MANKLRKLSLSKLFMNNYPSVAQIWLKSTGFVQQKGSSLEG